MRTLVDISDSDLRALSEIGKRRRRSRASLIREAVTGYLAAHRQSIEADAFGLWGADAEDGLAYQRKVRAEW